MIFFLTAIWLPHGQLWAIIGGQSHSADVNHSVFLHFQPEGHREPRSKAGSLGPAERLVGFELGTFRFLLQRLIKNVGERSTAKNYRPVSFLSVVSKVFEKLVNNRIVDHLEKCGLFSDFQYGFMSCHQLLIF